jgi:hypothetical protein
MLRRTNVMALSILVFLGCAAGAEAPIPPFGRDTVLVWKVTNEGDTDAGTFVVRIAEFLPNRFIEWENAQTQGTIFMSHDAVTKSRVFVNARLFEAGVDSKGKDSTTLWLSQRVFRELKAKGRVKLAIDSLDGWMTLEGSEQIQVEVNKVPTEVPVVKVKDDRGMERWFLDLEENPLMVKHSYRAYSQTLKSITTDRPNTLRWIKGKKLGRGGSF